jgi:transcriptional regulator with XRE-family HTH domain
MRKLPPEEKQFLVSLGRRIRELRKSKALSQQEAADLCNAEKANLSRIESGKTNPTVLTIRKLAEALQVSLTEIMLH